MLSCGLAGDQKILSQKYNAAGQAPHRAGCKPTTMANLLPHSGFVSTFQNAHT